jgi:signal transduction histidine kinase
VVARSVQQVRNMSLDMRPPMLDDFGLAAALKWHLGRLAALRAGGDGQRLGAEVHFSAQTPGSRLPPELEAACYRVAQEALTNVLRHAWARNVWVDLRQDEEGVELTVRDDGAGFDVAAARQRAVHGGSLGLLGMQERVELLGGTFAVESIPGDGTTVRLRLAAPPDGEEGAAP